MSLKNHPFFKMLELAEVGDKRAGRWGVGDNLPCLRAAMRLLELLDVKLK